MAQLPRIPRVGDRVQFACGVGIVVKAEGGILGGILWVRFPPGSHAAHAYSTMPTDVHGRAEDLYPFLQQLHKDVMGPHLAAVIQDLESA